MSYSENSIRNKNAYRHFSFYFGNPAPSDTALKGSWFFTGKEPSTRQGLRI